MLGGSTFGISSDDPYFFPGQKINQANLPSQLQAAGKTWKGYYQGMPYPGYRGYCFPAKCNGIPDSDTLYVAKHNGIPNFANLQTSAEFANQVPYGQLSTDLAAGRVPNFSYCTASATRQVSSSVCVGPRASSATATSRSGSSTPRTAATSLSPPSSLDLSRPSTSPSL